MATLVVIPTLNEADHIRRVLDELLADPGSEASAQLRVVVVDGGSTDGTTEAVQAVDDPRVSLVHNPRRLQSAAVNLAARTAHDDETVVVRVDAHSSYPPGWVQRVTASLLERVDEGCVSVVVPMLTVGEAPLQRAIAATQNSVLGNGGSSHRSGGESGWIDHGHHAAMLRSALLEVGGYDETMVANEDAELDERLRAAGGRIWFDADAEIVYHPRRDLRALARQYARYGEGRATTILRHRAVPKIRQVLPVIVTLTNVGCLALAPRRPAALVLPAGYAAGCLAFAGVEAARSGDPALLLMAPAAMVQHQAWGYGFLRRLLARH